MVEAKNMVLNNGTGEAVNGITSTIKFEGEIVFNITCSGSNS